MQIIILVLKHMFLINNIIAIPTMHILQNLFAFTPICPSNSDALGLSHFANSTGATTRTSCASDSSCITTPFSSWINSAFSGWNISIAIAELKTNVKTAAAACKIIFDSTSINENHANLQTHFPQHWNKWWRKYSATWCSHSWAMLRIAHTTY